VRRFINDGPVEAALGIWAYVGLVLVDLASTTIMLRAFPAQAGEANGVMARVLDAYGIAGLWAVKLAGAALVVGLFLGVRAYGRSRGPAVRRGANVALVACSVVQAAVVLVNIVGFARVVSLG